MRLPLKDEAGQSLQLAYRGLTLIWRLEGNESETPALAIVVSHHTRTAMWPTSANDLVGEYGLRDLPDNLTKLKSRRLRP